MTLVGKIFTVLIFVMSIVFMSFSVMVFATHKNWKEHATNTDTAGGKKLGLEQQLATMKQLKTDADNAGPEAPRRAEERNGRPGARPGRSDDRAWCGPKGNCRPSRPSWRRSRRTTRKWPKRPRARRTAWRPWRAEIGGMRADLRATEKDLDGKVHRGGQADRRPEPGRRAARQREEKNTQAVLQIAQMKMVMDAHGLRPDTLVAHIPPKVEGVVLEVSDKDLIEISIGKDDGLKEGHTLEVYRDNTYLGRIVIRRTAPDRAVGQIIKELQRGQIKRGDRVSTKLS